MGLEGPARKGSTTAIAVLVALSVSHLLNDTIQSLIAAVYPVLKDSYALTFTQIGLITEVLRKSSRAWMLLRWTSMIGSRTLTSASRSA